MDEQTVEMWTTISQGLRELADRIDYAAVPPATPPADPPPDDTTDDSETPPVVTDPTTDDGWTPRPFAVAGDYLLGRGSARGPLTVPAGKMVRAAAGDGPLPIVNGDLILQPGARAFDIQATQINCQGDNLVEGCVGVGGEIDPGLYVTNAKNVLVFRSRFTTPALNKPAAWVTNTEHVRLEHCLIHDVVGSHGIYARGPNTDLQVLDCLFANIFEEAIKGRAPTVGLMILRTYFWKCGNAVTIRNEDWSSHPEYMAVGPSVVSCVFDQTKVDFAIQLMNIRNGLISGNRFMRDASRKYKGAIDLRDRVIGGVTYQSTVNGLTIQNNTFYDWVGPWLFWSGQKPVEGECVVLDNVRDVAVAEHVCSQTAVQWSNNAMADLQLPDNLMGAERLERMKSSLLWPNPLGDDWER